MMVTMTSCAPVRAFKRPTKPPHSAAAATPANSAEITWRTGFMVKWKPTYEAEIAPNIN